MSVETKMKDKKNFVDTLFTNALLKFGQTKNSIKALINNLNTTDPEKYIIKHAFTILDNPEKNARIAGAIAMRQLYLECPLTISEYADTFKEELRDDVYSFMKNNQTELNNAIQYERDFSMTFFQAKTAIVQYLKKLKYSDTPKEIMQFAWMRVAVGSYCSREVKEEIKMSNILFAYDLYAKNKAVPATPTIFNLGFKRGAPSSCMLDSIDDNIEDIYDVLAKAAFASKNNAGLGINFSRIRHSNIGKDGHSRGVIPLIKVFEASVKYVDQGGKRPGACTVSLRDFHYDLPEFIKLTSKTGEEDTRVAKLNTSVLFSDLFWKRLEYADNLEKGGEKIVWTLFCPKQTKNLVNLYGEAFEKEYIMYEQKAKVWSDYRKYKIMENIISKNSGVKNGSLNSEKLQLYNELRKEFENLTDEPEEIDSRQFSILALNKEITEMQVTTGMPYVAHFDNINRKNAMANVGNVDTLNLCQEVQVVAVPGDQTGCCNLSSIALDKFVTSSATNGSKEFDFKEFGKTVRFLVRSLNCVIDETRNVTEKVIKSNKLNRPIGIGVSGFGDMCNLMNIPISDPHKLPKIDGIDENGEIIYKYVSYTEEQPSYTEDALLERTLNPVLEDLNWKIWSCMYYNALLGSCDEAEKFGPYPNFSTSQAAEGRLQYHLWQEEKNNTGRDYKQKMNPVNPCEFGFEEKNWDSLIEKIKKIGLRNCLLLACMPTASSASLLNTTESTEFYSSNIFRRSVQGGEYIIINYKAVGELESLGLWNAENYTIITQNDGSILKISEDGLTEENKIKLRLMKEKYLTMFEIRQKLMIDLAAQRQVVIDQSQSFNLYQNSPTEKWLTNIHLYTNKQGMKTGMYYLRSTAILGAMKINGAEKKEKRIMKGEISDVEMEVLKQKEKEIRDEISEKQKLEIQESIETAMKSSGKEIPMPEVCTRASDCISCQ